MSIHLFLTVYDEAWARGFLFALACIVIYGRRPNHIRHLKRRRDFTRIPTLYPSDEPPPWSLSPPRDTSTTQPEPIHTLYHRITNQTDFTLVGRTTCGVEFEVSSADRPKNSISFPEGCDGDVIVWTLNTQMMLPIAVPINGDIQREMFIHYTRARGFWISSISSTE